MGHIDQLAADGRCSIRGRRCALQLVGGSAHRHDFPDLGSRHSQHQEAHVDGQQQGRAQERPRRHQDLHPGVQLSRLGAQVCRREVQGLA